MLTCLEGDIGREHVVFFSLWVNFMCYVYSSILLWCFQIASAKHAKWQHMLAIKAKL